MPRAQLTFASPTLLFTHTSPQNVMIYFSAHWCPPCRGFTPKLCEFYTNFKKVNSDFELVFVSSDRDEAAFKEYYGEVRGGVGRSEVKL